MIHPFKKIIYLYSDFTPLDSVSENVPSDVIIDEDDLITKDNEKKSNKPPIPIIEVYPSLDYSFNDSNDENEFLGYRSDTSKSRIEESKSKRKVSSNFVLYDIFDSKLLLLYFEIP